MKTAIGLTVLDEVEGRSTGIDVDDDGYTALTLTESHTFKTRGGAVRWLGRRGYNPDGSRKAVRS